MNLEQAANVLVAQAELNRERWNSYERTPAEHLLVATEELGEVARAMQTWGGYQWPPQYNPSVREELIDLGAVVLAMLVECG